MNTFTKLPLSASVNGKQILVSSTTSASANPIHTAVAGTASLDEIWLYAHNAGTASIQVSVLWGGITEPNDVVRTTLAPQTSRTLIVDGKLLQNSLIVQAYASASNLISIDGFVNRIT